MKTKPCRKCGVTKPLTDFHKHPKMPDGTINECKVCKRAYARALREANVEEYRRYDRKRAKDPKRKKSFAEKQKRQRAEKQGQQHAHNVVARALTAKILKRPRKCERCSATNVQAHHDDYSKPLAVMWLCPPCHAARHNELGRLRMSDD